MNTDKLQRYCDYQQKVTVRDLSILLMKMAETAVKLQKIMGTVVSRKMLYQMPGPEVLAKAKQDYGITL